jgi:TolB protein
VGLAEIFLMNADGTGAIQIAGLPGQFPGLATMPSWSPDGLRILFTGFLGGMGQGDLLVMNADGSNWVNLTNNDVVRDEYGAWSPDGREIAFVRWVVVGTAAHPYIHVMNADGSNVRQLTSGDIYDLSPAWSPDSRRIVFARQTAEGTASRIYSISSTGTGLRPLTDDQGVDSEPSWSRDGERLLFNSGRDGSTWVDTDIWAGRADGMDGMNVTRTPPDTDFNPRWLPVP